MARLNSRQSYPTGSSGQRIWRPEDQMTGNVGPMPDFGGTNFSRMNDAGRAYYAAMVGGTGPNRQQNAIMQARQAGGLPVEATQDETRNQLITHLSAIAGGSGSRVNLEQAQQLPGWQQLAERAAAAGLDPEEIVMARDRNIGNYEQGGFASNIGDWMDRSGVGDLITYGTIAGAGMGAAGAFGVGPFSGGTASGAGGGSSSGVMGAAQGGSSGLTGVTVPASATHIPVATGTGAIIPGGAVGSVAAPATGVGAPLAQMPSASTIAGVGGGASGLSEINVGDYDVGRLPDNMAGNTSIVDSIMNGATEGVNLPEWAQVATEMGGSLLGGIMQDRAASDAADSRLQAMREQLGFLRETRDMTMEQQEPFMQGSETALAQMLGMTGSEIPDALGSRLEQAGIDSPGEFDITQDPSYQFRLDESMRALEAGAAARGGLLSGGHERQALRLASEYASKEYQNIFDRLGKIASFGPQAGATAAGANNMFGQVGSGAIGAAGATSAYADVAQGNVRGQTIQDLIGSASSLYS